MTRVTLMRATRRTLLRLPLLVAVVGCAPSPVIIGDPGDVPEPDPPTRSAEAAAIATWVAGFAAKVEELALPPAAWGADAASIAWIMALQEQSSAHVSRVVAADPVIGGPTVFATPSVVDNNTVVAPTTPAEVLVALTDEVAAGAPILREGVETASVAQDRLLYASLAVAMNASLTPALPPIEGGAGPSPFTDVDEAASLAVALGHARALITGLELGLGRLPSANDLRAAGKERLDAAKEVRNTLIASLAAELPEVDVWELPNAMSTPEEILAAWATLEGNLLDAFGTLTAAATADAGDWLDSMLAQVPWVHRWGGRLPYWPGWVATS